MKIRDYARIVIDGMDGSGKSFLTNQVMAYLGEQGHYIPGYNRVVGEKPPMPQWWMDQLAYNPPGKVVVHDRFFYPELVYGPVLRHRLAMDKGTQSYVQNFLRNRAFLIYCRPPIAIISEGIEKEHQMKGVKENFGDLIMTYDQLMIDEGNIMEGRFMKYDWTEPTGLAKLLSRLAGYIYQ
jgi:thymidylate kinase